MSGSSENMSYARQCANCNEIMPLSELVCYCGGPVCIIEISSEDTVKFKEYRKRKLIHSLNNVE